MSAAPGQPGACAPAGREARAVRAPASGQAAVETALVMPMLLFVILGILQLTLAQQARLMLEYAAFAAARVGVVWNGDPDKMQQAAVLALMPTLPAVPGARGGGARVDTPEALAREYEIFARSNAVVGPEVFGRPAIAVTVLNPKEEDFGDAQEIDFDAPGPRFADRQRSQLTIRVTYLYELRIPFANWLLFESWLAGSGGISLIGYDPGRPEKMRSARGERVVTDLRERLRIEAEEARVTHCTYTGLGREDLRRLAGLASRRGRYFLPLVTTYTMRMQSNPFRRFAARPGPGC